MIIPPQYQCEICGHEHGTALAVRDEIAILNGADSRAYAYVCAKCIKAVVEALDDLFPKNKYNQRRLAAERVATSVKQTMVV